MRLADRIPANTASGLYVGSIVDILARMGLDPSSARAQMGCDKGALMDPHTRIHIDQLTDLFDFAVQETDNPVVGLEVGFNFRVATFADTGSVLSYCENLREASKMNRRYQPLVETMGMCSFEEDGSRAFLQWKPNSDDDERIRQVTELIVGGYAATVQWLGWAFETPALGFFFRHKAAAGEAATRTYRRILRADPEFGAMHNRLEFGPGVADEPLPTSSPESLETVCRRLDKLLFGQSETGQLSELRGRLVDGLEDGLTTREALATELGLSLYQLDRQLSDAGTSFRALLDEARTEKFHRLVKRGAPLSEISFALGFNDQAAFTKAFQRWYGITPGRYVTGGL